MAFVRAWRRLAGARCWPGAGARIASVFLPEYHVRAASTASATVGFSAGCPTLPKVGSSGPRAPGEPATAGAGRYREDRGTKCPRGFHGDEKTRQRRNSQSNPAAPAGRGRPNHAGPRQEGVRLRGDRPCTDARALLFRAGRRPRDRAATHRSVRRQRPGGPIMTLASLPFRLLIRGYQLGISPWLPSSCRYLPTCSDYSLEAVGRHGPVAGGWLALRRILRCHPFGGSGYDPVPSLGEQSVRNRHGRA